MISKVHLWLLLGLIFCLGSVIGGLLGYVEGTAREIRTVELRMANVMGIIHMTTSRIATP